MKFSSSDLDVAVVVKILSWGGVVEFFLTLTFLGGLIFFLGDYTLIKHIFPEG